MIRLLFNQDDHILIMSNNIGNCQGEISPISHSPTVKHVIQKHMTHPNSPGAADAKIFGSETADTHV